MNLLKDIKPGFKQFLIRTLVFLILFIGISLVIGQKIVASKLLYEFGIYVYGGMGYILLFSLVGFFLLYRKRLSLIGENKYRLLDGCLLVLSFLLIGAFYILELNIDRFAVTLLNIALVHLLFLSMLTLLLVGVYGIPLLRTIIKDFKREILYFLVFGLIIYSAMWQVFKLWPYFSWIVLQAVYHITSLFTNNVDIIPSPQGTILKIENFSAIIAEACSGVYSIFLFVALYLFIILMDWKKINKSRAFALFLPALIGAFLVNIVRVLFLMLAGAYVSRELALGLYHSYMGMIFFLIYFGIFWAVFYPFMSLDKNKSWISRLYTQVKNDSLYRNSVYLMLSTLIMSVLGFIFWIVVARNYTSQDVGLATTIISVAGIITSISCLGIGTGLIRFLPQSKRKDDKINSAFSLVSLVTIIVTTIFLLGISFFSPKLGFIKNNLIESLAFIVFMILASLSSLIDNIFMAYRANGFTLLKNTIFSIFKIFFVLLFVWLGAYGIFTGWMLALGIAWLVSFLVLTSKFSYRPKAVFHDSVLKTMGKYSFGNYVAGFIGSLPALAIPLIITSHLATEQAAYYYMAMMIAALLFIIPSSVSSSLFAEGSYTSKDLRVKVKKSIRMTALVLIPAMLAILLVGKYILRVFGPEYAIQGNILLTVLALSSVFIAINGIYGSLLRIRKSTNGLIVVNLLGAITTLGLVYILIAKGLLGVGIAWTAGKIVQFAASAIWYAVVVRKS